MEQKTRILIVTPTCDLKDYCVERWAAMVNSIAAGDGVQLDCMVIDNSDDPSYIGKLRKLSFRPKTVFARVERVEQDKDLRYLMARCNEVGRKFVIDNGYDHMLSLESDIFPPEGFLDVLLSSSHNIIGLPYFIGQYHVSFPLVEQDIDDSFTLQMNTHRTVHEGLMMTDGTIKEVNQVGLGCVLISREVLSLVPFCIDDEVWAVNDTGVKAHADTFFNIQCRKEGIPIYCDTSMMCHHENINWASVKRF